MIDRIQKLIHHPNTKPFGIGVAVFCGGFGLGFGLARMTRSDIIIEPDEEATVIKFPDIIWAEDSAEEDHTEDLLDSLTDIVIDPPNNDPADIKVDFDAIERRDMLINEHGFTEGMRLYREEYFKSESDKGSDVVSVFNEVNADWDQDSEEGKRTKDSPYILNKDEFWAEELDYKQTTLTYYASDDILVDQTDVPIYNYKEVVGTLNFGHGSSDQNVVYVRNDKLKAEYEILKDRGSYSVEVLGLEYEAEEERASLKHSITKFRPGD